MLRWGRWIWSVWAESGDDPTPTTERTDASCQLAPRRRRRLDWSPEGAVRMIYGIACLGRRAAPGGDVSCTRQNSASMSHVADRPAGLRALPESRHADDGRDSSDGDGTNSTSGAALHWLMIDRQLFARTQRDRARDRSKWPGNLHALCSGHACISDQDLRPKHRTGTLDAAQTQVFTPDGSRD